MKLIDKDKVKCDLADPVWKIPGGRASLFSENTGRYCALGKYYKACGAELDKTFFFINIPNEIYETLQAEDANYTNLIYTANDASDLSDEMSNLLAQASPEEREEIYKRQHLIACKLAVQYSRDLGKVEFIGKTPEEFLEELDKELEVHVS